MGYVEWRQNTFKSGAGVTLFFKLNPIVPYEGPSNEILCILVAENNAYLVYHLKFKNKGQLKLAQKGVWQHF